VHALSKFLYDRMFEYLVYRVNKVLKSQVDVQSFIGVLDIFGFEMFTQVPFTFSLNF
jgi:myosin heavy subunit